MPRKFALILGALAAIPAFAQTIERPAVKVGDECHYNVFDNMRKDGKGEPEKVAERHAVVTAVEPDRIVVNFTQTILVPRDTEDIEAGEYVYDRDLNQLQINARKFEPAYPYRYYPLTPGAEKKAKSEFPRLQGDGTTTVNLTGKASGWENIAVPAGKFDTITLVWEGGNINRITRGRTGTGSAPAYETITLSPATWCTVKGIKKNYKMGGQGIWSDRTSLLMSFKN